MSRRCSLLLAAGSNRDRRSRPTVRRPQLATHAVNPETRGVPGGLGMECHAFRYPPRRGGLTSPLQYLPGPDGQIRRDSSHTGIHPGKGQGEKTRLPACRISGKTCPQARRPCRGAGAAPAATQHAQHGSPRFWLPAAAEYRGIVQYYLLAGDVWRLDRLEWVMKTSMLKTLAHRHCSTATKMAAKHKAVIDTPADRADALKPASNETAGSRWSHGSEASRSGGSTKRSLMTARKAQPSPAAGN